MYEDDNINSAVDPAFDELEGTEDEIIASYRNRVHDED